MAIALPSVLTQGLYSSLVAGISSMTFGIFGTVKSIYNHKNPDLTNHLKRLDIEYHLRLISSVLKNQSHSPVTTIKEHIDNKSIIFSTVPNNKISEDPLEICLIYLSKSVNDIHKTLLSINQKVVYHQTKWFGSYRTLNISPLLTQLEIDIDILKNRFNDFIKIYNIYRHNTSDVIQI